jgi:WD40 repeat protein
MHAARLDAVAVGLKDGRVLIAGGSPNDTEAGPVLASAEIYDPVSKTFTATGSLTTARGGATGVLLNDGRVLVFGGSGCPPKSKSCTPEATVGNVVASAEIYDPASSTFTPTGSLTTRLVSANAVLMPDGRVFVFGTDTVVQAYDPGTGQFTNAGSLLDKYGETTATLLPNGKVLVTGDVLNLTAELFDPASGKSTAISLTTMADLKYMSGPQTATMLKNGQVLVAINGYLATYDPATNSFTEAGTNTKPRTWIGATATLLSDGGLFFAGGSIESADLSSFSIANLAGIYDPATGFHLIHSMTGTRTYHSATLLPDGTVLIAGGWGSSANESAVSSAELFIP